MKTMEKVVHARVAIAEPKEAAKEDILDIHRIWIKLLKSHLVPVINRVDSGEYSDEDPEVILFRNAISEIKEPSTLEELNAIIWPKAPWE